MRMIQQLFLLATLVFVGFSANADNRVNDTGSCKLYTSLKGQDLYVPTSYPVEVTLQNQIPNPPVSLAKVTATTKQGTDGKKTYIDLDAQYCQNPKDNWVVIYAEISTRLPDNKFCFTESSTTHVQDGVIVEFTCINKP